MQKIEKRSQSGNVGIACNFIVLEKYCPDFGFTTVLQCWVPKENAHILLDDIEQSEQSQQSGITVISTHNIRSLLIENILLSMMFTTKYLSLYLAAITDIMTGNF